MICPFCSHESTKVLETRDTSPTVTRRRRECLSCDRRFTTYEQIELTNVVVQKKSGAEEAFNRDKLIQSLEVACRKRPISRQRIEELVNDIEAAIRSMKKSKVTSTEIGELVMDRLMHVDRVAYVRFASVYKEFEDVDNFEQVLANLR